MERLSPAERPLGRPRGFQRWRDLLFLHWPVSSECLRPLVPSTLHLDTHDGTHYVGIVAFAMQGVRPAWAPEALALSFLETNVRTYVVSERGEPGVYFFSLDAASRVAVEVARSLWGLPYFFATMEAKRHLAPQGRHERWEYSLCRRRGRLPAQLHALWTTGERFGTSVPGSLDHFLIERYVLFTVRGAVVLRGQVHHPPYPLRSVELEHVRETLIEATGLPAPDGPPPLVHASDGVDVEIFGLSPSGG